MADFDTKLENDSKILTKTTDSKYEEKNNGIRMMTNGDVIKGVFPNIKVKYYRNLSGMQTVDVKFSDKSFNGQYSVHTFSREWWDAKYQKER